MKATLALVLVLAVAAQQVFAKPNAGSLKELLQKHVQKIRSEVKKGSGNGRGSGSGSGSGSGEGSGAGPEYDYAADVQAKCGFDVSAMYAQVGQPVDKPTLDGVIQEVQALANTYAEMVGDHNTGMDAFEAALADPSVDLETYLTQHGELIEGFADDVKEMGEAGFCSFARLGPIRYRMEIAGVSGFRTETKCNTAGVFLLAAYARNEWDEGRAAADVLSQLPEVGKLLRSDIRCLGNDVKDYRDFAATVRVNGDMSGRQAILTLDALTGYMEDIGRDVMHLLETAGHLGQMLDESEKKTVSKKNLELRSELRKLLKAVERYA